MIFCRCQLRHDAMRALPRCRALRLLRRHFHFHFMLMRRHADIFAAAAFIDAAIFCRCCHIFAAIYASADMLMPLLMPMMLPFRDAADYAAAAIYFSLDAA